MPAAFAVPFRKAPNTCSFRQGQRLVHRDVRPVGVDNTNLPLITGASHRQSLLHVPIAFQRRQ